MHPILSNPAFTRLLCALVALNDGAGVDIGVSAPGSSDQLFIKLTNDDIDQLSPSFVPPAPPLGLPIPVFPAGVEVIDHTKRPLSEAQIAARMPPEELAAAYPGTAELDAILAEARTRIERDGPTLPDDSKPKRKRATKAEMEARRAAAGGAPTSAGSEYPLDKDEPEPEPNDEPEPDGGPRDLEDRLSDALASDTDPAATTPTESTEATP